MSSGSCPKNQSLGGGSKVLSHILPPQYNALWYGKGTTGFYNGSYDSSIMGAYNEEIEREVAENIFDWWISKKSYKQWYADKFLQQELDFDKASD